MNDPELYNENNQVQTYDAEEVIRNFNGILSQFNNDRTSDRNLLDIGTGCGKVLAEVIFEQLKMKFNKVVGIDISEEMVKFARKKYENDLVKFKCGDVLGDMPTAKAFFSTNEMQLESFDVVSSFNCLHWIQDLGNAFLNIRSFLKPNGYFLCTLLKRVVIYDAYLKFAANDKYSKYMQDVQKFIPPTYYAIDTLKTVRELLTEVGFEIKFLEHKVNVFDFETKFKFKNLMKSINPFINRMPECLQYEYMDEMEDFVDTSKGTNFTENSFEISYEITYFIVTNPSNKA